MSLQWDGSLVLGIDELDKQHKTIVDNFVRLSESVQAGSSEEAVVDLTNFLIEYAQVHFASEDKYMVKYCYPDIEVQRNEHAQFTRDANEFINRIHQDGASREIAIEITGKLIRWIIQHIKNHDRDMYAYVKGRMGETQNE